MYYDTRFHYSNVVRAQLILKNFIIKSNYTIPMLNKLNIYFAVRKLENRDHPKIYNYLFLFRFFFGLSGYITNYNSIFILNKTYYSFDVAAGISKKNNYYLIYYLAYELLPAAVTITNYIKNTKHNKKSLVLTLWDMNLFTEKKTSLGLFDLVDPINYQFILNTGIIKLSKKNLLLNEFKINYEN